jgi:hypothetical protein
MVDSLIDLFISFFWVTFAHVRVQMVVTYVWSTDGEWVPICTENIYYICMQNMQIEMEMC